MNDRGANNLLVGNRAFNKGIQVSVYWEDKRFAVVRERLIDRVIACSNSCDVTLRPWKSPNMSGRGCVLDQLHPHVHAAPYFYYTPY